MLGSSTVKLDLFSKFMKYGSMRNLQLNHYSYVIKNEKNEWFHSFTNALFKVIFKLMLILCN